MRILNWFGRWLIWLPVVWGNSPPDISEKEVNTRVVPCVVGLSAIVLAVIIAFISSSHEYVIAAVVFAVVVYLLAGLFLYFKLCDSHSSAAWTEKGPW